MNPATPVRSAACLIPREQSAHCSASFSVCGWFYLTPQRRFFIPASLSATGVFRAAMALSSMAKRLVSRSATVWFRYRVAGNTVENFVTRVPYHHRTRSIDLLLNTFCSADIITVSLTKRRSFCFITGKNVTRYRQWCSPDSATGHEAPEYP